MNGKAIVRIIIISVLIVGVVTAWGVISAFNSYGRMLEYDDPIPTEKLEKPLPDRINVLLIGTDKSGANTDVIMVMSYDKGQNMIKTVSIPRDTRVLVGSKYSKINACMAISKEALLFDTIKAITGMPINYYIKIDTAGFRQVIDILGGVEFDVPQRMYYKDPTQGLNIDLQPGMQMLDGNKAEQLVRFRRYIEGDIQRTRVQQDFISALIHQKLKAENILKLPQLYSEMAKYVKTNISASDIVGNLEVAKVFSKSGGGVKSLELPGYVKYINGVSYFLHDTDKTLKMFKDEFGGSGESAMRDKYIYANTKDIKDKVVPTPAPKTAEPQSPTIAPDTDGQNADTDVGNIQGTESGNTTPPETLPPVTPLPEEPTATDSPSESTD